MSVGGNSNPLYIADTADIAGTTAVSGYAGLGMTVGGVACNVEGMIVLLTNQATQTENGPILVHDVSDTNPTGAWEQIYPNAASGRPLFIVTGGFNAGMWWPDLVDWSAGATTWTVRRFHPPGSILMTGASSAPTGWLLCDGSAVSRAGFPTLFAAIGTTFGVGDGTTTFNLPDLRQRFPLGKAASGTGSTLGGTGGNIDHAHGSPLTTGTPSGTVAATILAGGAASTTHTHSLTVPTDNPPFQVVNYAIKI